MKTLKKLNLKTLSSARVLENKQMKEIRGGDSSMGCSSSSCSGECTYLGSRGHCSRMYIGDDGIFHWEGGMIIGPGTGGIDICGCAPSNY